MWIASKYGFFSIVKKGDGFHVRARAKNDLQALLAVTGIAGEVQVWPGADYRYRVILGAEAIPTVFQTLAASIDYNNFKSKIAATPSQRDKEYAYYEVWRALYQVQEAEEEDHRP
jgi:hypothetical protein